MTTRRTSGNKRKVSRVSGRQHLLELNVRTASVRRRRQGHIKNLLWKSGATVLLLSLIAVGARLACNKFFFKNTEYELRHLETNLRGVITEEELIALTGFSPGKNIFLLDMVDAQKKLSALPEVRSASVERKPPDTIEVGLERRQPVFLLAPSGDSVQEENFQPGKSLLCDRDGMVMRPSRLADQFLHLPVLRGIDLSGAVPGKRLDSGRLTDAVALWEALSEIPEETFRISSVDASKPYAITVTDSSGARFLFGSGDLPGQLERLRKLLAHCGETGRKIDTANLMIQRNTPVTFVLTPESGTRKITPAVTSKKASRN